MCSQRRERTEVYSNVPLGAPLSLSSPSSLAPSPRTSLSFPYSFPSARPPLSRLLVPTFLPLTPSPTRPLPLYLPPPAASLTLKHLVMAPSRKEDQLASRLQVKSTRVPVCHSPDPRPLRRHHLHCEVLRQGGEVGEGGSVSVCVCVFMRVCACMNVWFWEYGIVCVMVCRCVARCTCMYCYVRIWSV